MVLCSYPSVASSGSPLTSSKNDDAHCNSPSVALSIVSTTEVPYCPKCADGVLKPDVVFFGENLPPERKIKAASWIDNADLLLCLGTSLQTFSSYRLLLQAHATGTPIVIVNVGPTRGDSLSSLILNSGISDTLRLVHSLIV
ncbi:unnamed protein product [Echinostoma caproni]|uniref:Deacetylase sirtuin-type domain-containing protein n=1 Tax=Echinostoma caproni TaxID=27848 RepID=A0A183B6K7_9TREM|nr:unnamed protein product [Echinostoma caproni]